MTAFTITSRAFPPAQRFGTDETKLNFAALPSRFDKNVNIVDKPASIALRKAIKNPVEIENTKKAHILDGVAFTRFMKWVKENVGKIPMDEITASDYLEQRRAEQEGCWSFPSTPSAPTTPTRR